MQRHRSAAAVLVLILCVALVDCRVKTTPQAAVAHYGTTAARALALYQGAVIRASDTGLISVDAARPSLDAIRTALATCQSFSSALKVYDAAASSTSAAAVAGFLTTLSRQVGSIAAVAPAELTAPATVMTASVSSALAGVATVLGLKGDR